MDDEVELQSYLSCTITHSKPDVLYGAGTACPQLFMEGDDWKKCWGEVLKIYWAAGAGNVKVGDVVGFYFGGGQWYSANGHKKGCPGTPTVKYSFAAREKWNEDWGEVFQIYAKGKYYGDTIQDHDNIAIYYVREKNWVALVGHNPGLSTCLGETWPPPPDRYDKCWGEIFELWLR